MAAFLSPFERGFEPRSRVREAVKKRKKEESGAKRRKIEGIQGYKPYRAKTAPFW
ncbi:hypothetical protein COLO4_06006 [Corchorus olitorius]|uniref:Uncharacterized protein n=1 Tax=Corchorus olitorius TaxID=93759 RepID=A0A1R3KPC3_9ROSI|nr:hypothetical protein COLO4_06006 [Corchorus olitorius]